MALFKFTDAILNGRVFDVYNYGDIRREFTNVDDLVEGIRLLIAAIPSHGNRDKIEKDSLSPVAQFRVRNIGNSMPTKLMEFIESIEHACGLRAKINFLPIQPGNVKETYTNNDLLWELTGFRPSAPVNEGVSSFVSWFRSDYHKQSTHKVSDRSS